MYLPSDQKRLVPWAEEIIDRCSVSMGSRASSAKAMQSWLYNGSPDGSKAIFNMLYPHVDRLASYLFSPSDLRFHFDFTHHYPKNIQQMAEVAGRTLTRQFERRDIDIQFGQGVGVALTYGACIPKLLDAEGGISCKLVMPWQIGVYREDKADFDEQEAINEVNFITPFDLWRRISHMPNAAALFKRAMNSARSGKGEANAAQVVIAGISPAVQTDPTQFSQTPGGIVNLTPGLGAANLSPQVQDELIALHELWVWDDELEDWTTIQMAAPDILIAPKFRRRNIFVPGEHPYGLIQPNMMPNYFWGRSELEDLMKLQHLLKDRLEDIKKIMALQYDRRYAFIGGEQITAEQYDEMMLAGYVNLGAGGDVKDITPKLPDHSFEEVSEILKLINEATGFNNILSGQGEPGVRAGNHAQTLMRTASPRLRDRALIVERQCADFAHKAFELMVSKNASAYWTDGEESEFLLSQIPDDYRVMIDSHSSSPIYEEDHSQMAFALAKLQAIGAEDLISLLPLPRKDLLIQHAKEMQAQKAAMIEAHPELLQHGSKKK